MASTQPPDYRPHHPVSTNREGRVAAWARDNARLLGIAGGAVVVVLVGGYGWQLKRRGDEQRAERALINAQAAALQSTGAPDAERGLRDVANRYGGTLAGTQALLLLAQTLYDQGRYQDGLSVLARGKPSDAFATAFRMMTASGLEGAGRSGEAAKIYEELATGSNVVPRRRDELRASAARAYQLANDRSNAARIWRALAQDGTAGIADEARVRAGELSSS